MIDNEQLSKWRKDYLNGMTAQEWVDFGLKLTAEKVNHDFVHE